MEQVLRRPTSEPTSVLDNLPDAICRIDLDLRCSYANRTCTTLLGVRAGALIETTQVRASPSLEPLGNAWVRECRWVIQRGELTTLSFQRQLPSGVHRYAMRVIPEFEPPRKVISILSIATEIGPERQETLCGALSELSHKLRTPLNAILGWTQLLQSHQASVEMLRRALQQIEQSAQTQARVIDDVLHDLDRVPGRPHAPSGTVERADSSSPSERTKPLLAGIAILIVDDDASTRDMLQEALTRAGAQVRSIGSARQALAEIQRWRPDILLSDIGMPDVDGFELLRLLRRLPAERGGLTPAVALTGYAREEDQAAARAAGYHAVALKPVSLRDLTVTLADLATRR